MVIGAIVSVDAIVAWTFHENKKKPLTNSLNIKHISDNKLFWKSDQPFFTNKESNSSKITLIEENKNNEEGSANIMNKYFKSLSGMVIVMNLTVILAIRWWKIRKYFQ